MDIVVSIVVCVVSKNSVPGTNANATSFGISVKFIGLIHTNINQGRPISLPRSRSKAGLKKMKRRDRPSQGERGKLQRLRKE